MRNPLRDELTPSAGLERRIEDVLSEKGKGPQSGVRGELDALTGRSSRRWRRGALLAGVALMPLLAFLAVTVVSQGALPLHVIAGTGAANVPQGTGHTAPLLATTPVAGEAARPVATQAALIPTPTVIPMDTDACSGGVNAAGTPVAQTPECIAAQQAPFPRPTRPAPSNPSER